MKTTTTQTAKKYCLIKTRKSDGVEFTHYFKTKKDMRRYMSNNYTEYNMVEVTK
jgi:hypothetical protein